jgi:hypothetical protein
LERRLVDYCDPHDATQLACQHSHVDLSGVQSASAIVHRGLWPDAFPGPFESDSVLRHTQETDAHLFRFAVKLQFEPLS